jgi:UDP-N-acetylmuramyl pentapeptide phosphotransferase/UDP-N-acetylglucosamine-1-phosphate transferase
MEEIKDQIRSLKMWLGGMLFFMTFLVTYGIYEITKHEDWKWVMGVVLVGMAVIMCKDAWDSYKYKKALKVKDLAGKKV